MANVQGTFYTATTQRRGVTPVSPPNAVDDPIDPVLPPIGSHPAVTIGSPANGLSINTTTQVLSIGLASASQTGALSATDWATFNGKLNLTSPITGYTVGGNTAIADTDTLLGAFGKIQGQINARVSGTIASGQVAFGTGVNTVGGISTFVYDSVNNRLGINRATPAATLDVNGNVWANNQFRLNNNTGSITNNVGNQLLFFSEILLETRLSAPYPNSFLSFYNGSPITEKMRLTASGQLWIGTTSGTNTLDVNGTTRIRTISNLGSTATRFLVASATGVISERTGAELAADIGATNFWTLTGSDIFRNSSVAIGRTTIPTNATFAVQSMTSTATNKYLQFLNNSGAELVSLTQSGILLTTSPLANFGNATTNIATGGPTIKGGVVNGNSDAIFRVNSSGDTSVFEVRSGRGIVVSVTQSFFGGIPSSNIAAGGPTIKSGAINGNLSSIFNILNSAEGLVLEVRPNYLISYSPAAHFGSPTSGIATGAHFKGNANNTAVIFQIDNSSNTPLFRLRGNGDIIFSEGRGFELGTVTGWKIGTATDQRLSFWNKTPIVQPTTGITGATRVGGGGTTITDTDTFGGYTVAQVVQALINTGLLA